MKNKINHTDYLLLIIRKLFLPFSLALMISPLANSEESLAEFNPMDVIIPKGHTIQLVVSETGEDYLPSPCAALGMTIFEGYQVLTLPVLDRPINHENWFNVPVWWDE